jgi:hypothetical protein
MMFHLDTQEGNKKVTVGERTMVASLNSFVIVERRLMLGMPLTLELMP